MSPENTTDETSSLLPLILPETNPHDEADQSHSFDTKKSRTALQFRVAAAMYSFIVLGLFTSSIGVILPPMMAHYNLSLLRGSLIFLVGPIGYVIASQCNAIFHAKYGQLGVAVTGPTLHIVSAGVIATLPPYPVLLVSFAFNAAGTGLLDGSWCAWAATMESANTVSGLLHGSFSVGAAAGPFLAGALMDGKRRAWFGWGDWYYVLVSLSFKVGELALNQETRELALNSLDRSIHPRTPRAPPCIPPPQHHTATKSQK